MSHPSASLFPADAANATDGHISAVDIPGWNAIDWDAVAGSLEHRGCATLASLLDPAQCQALAALYADDARFRSRVVMSRHGFGSGEYKYFSYPLPPLVQLLRTALYARLAPIANRWNQAMDLAVRYPPEHGDFIQRCHQAGQTRPTPLILQYGKDDYNCLHQDL
jgi:hypothetical protein